MASKERSSQNTMKRKFGWPRMKRHEVRQALDVLAMDLDELELAAGLVVDEMMRGLDERALAHAARAPQQRVVGGQPLGEALGILDQDVARQIDALAGGSISTRLTLATGSSRRVGRMPDEGVAARRDRRAAAAAAPAAPAPRRCGSSGRQVRCSEVIGMARSIAAALGASAGKAPIHLVAMAGSAAIYRCTRTGRPTCSGEIPDVHHPAFAQAAGAPGTGDFIGMILPLVMIMVVFYFLLIRPQQRKVEGTPGTDQQGQPRRHGRHQRRPDRQGHQGGRRQRTSGRDRRECEGPGRCAAASADVRAKGEPVKDEPAKK